jgi:hypothetical protein
VADDIKRGMSERARMRSVDRGVPSIRRTSWD